MPTENQPYPKHRRIDDSLQNLGTCIRSLERFTQQIDNSYPTEPESKAELKAEPTLLSVLDTTPMILDGFGKRILDAISKAHELLYNKL